MDEYDIDDAWSSFCQSGEFLNMNNNLNIVTDSKIPKCSDIYISTKTKIAYLSSEINLNNLFWKINVMPYHKQCEGVVKKQMKFNFTCQEEVDDTIKILENEKNIDMYIINRIINPNGRIKFKDIRKISIGLSHKDITSHRCKKRSAFYNCFVLILRLQDNNSFKEVHIKVFNTGKLEIPGIREDKLLQKTLDLLVNILNNNLDEKIEACSIKDAETVLINSNFNCGFYINRDKLLEILKTKYNVDSVFDACQYPGIQCHMYIEKNEVTYKLSFMIFRTGSVLIVGKCYEDVLFEVYEKIKKILQEEYSEIYVSNTEQPIKDTVKNKKVKKKIITIN